MIDEQILLQQLDPASSRHTDFIELGQRIGASALNELMEYFGGEKKHIPHAAFFWEALKREVRNAEIKQKFNGRNYDELADEYGLTVRSLYRIIHRRPTGDAK